MKRFLGLGLLVSIGTVPSGVAGVTQTDYDIYVANLSEGHVSRFDGETGAFVSDFVPPGTGGLAGGTGIAFGPDGDLYVASSQTHQILRFDGDSGQLRGVHVETPDVQRPFSLIFGSDDHLYVSSLNRVLRFAPDGTPAGVVADGLSTPIGLRFDDEGQLWIANAQANEILRVDPATGERIGEPLTVEGLSFPSDLVFAPDGRLLVSNAFAGTVVAFDPESGEPLGTVVALPEGSVPVGVAIDSTGRLVIADFGASQLWRLDLETEELTLLSDEGMNSPENLTVRRGGQLNR